MHESFAEVFLRMRHRHVTGLRRVNENVMAADNPIEHPARLL
jgi:hypothetical protein